MVKKLNCWEHKKCGRESGGAKVAEFGVCPAAELNAKADGINCGKNAGRICWAIAGTFCGGNIQGDFAKKQLTCMGCDFFNVVRLEEGQDFCLLLPGQIYTPPKGRGETKA